MFCTRRLVLLAITLLLLAAVPSFALEFVPCDPSEDNSDPGQAVIVDAQTGKPVEHFAIQGRCPTDDPTKVSWCGETWSEGGSRGGRASISRGYVFGDHVEFRVVATGYQPQVVQAPLVNGHLSENPLTVKLDRGTVMNGQVLDYKGKPVSGARVLLSGPIMTTIINGAIEGPSGKPEQTDAKGCFTVTGGNDPNADTPSRVVILEPSIHAWVGPAASEGDAIIKLPEPAKLKIRYDVPGGEDEAEFRIQWKTWEMPECRGALDSVQTVKVRNGGEASLTLAPGVYDFARNKTFWIGDLGHGAFLDRKNLTLASGKTQEVSIIRKKGQRIQGQIVGLPAGMPGAFIRVMCLVDEGKYLESQPGFPIIFDCAATGPDGRFTTSLIPPGKYRVSVSAFGPEPRAVAFTTGIRLPEYVGEAVVTIKASGGHVRTRIEMKPRTGTPPLN